VRERERERERGTLVSCIMKDTKWMKKCICVSPPLVWRKMFISVTPPACGSKSQSEVFSNSKLEVYTKPFPSSFLLLLLLPLFLSSAPTFPAIMAIP
jgi:hypothetical protein